MIDSSAKSLRRESLKQPVAYRTGLTEEQVELLFIEGGAVDATFQEMYFQVEQLQETLQKTETENAALRQRSDIAAMKAQEYFVRLRDAGLLHKGEEF